ncbi:UDP-N-acetylmuramoyl-tripeptide--D-alanyl-D-alanine ligase [Marinicella litoralis]|uniref:UDP-N-acetylmuramoyl-tripeptide--D-alanyl-D-alanine ligase n=1 Tax=Marinicella litoralis TaxID=644220 RepID=A0A4R6XVZ0_9GAMM|nr:UDP-N-acetylmuramoyl-tripeptide--D-alanyl-D-alanine ligase [Marinicella litoralis]TDR22729.1 UDP-N-acetylmuramoyl-tripeptide--D-alanyl-D-alanine ligase [Marinicella litoralis]
MIQMNLHQVAAIVGGSLVGKEARIQGVEIDSRADCQGKLFVALKGARVDGHAFCQQAANQGAAAVLVSSAVEVDVPQIICEDSLQALQALASAWVKQTGVKVIGITGSNGKTTVKNMLYSVLSQNNQCMATQGNLNNEIGVPLTLLSISRSDDFAVIEMGAAQLGDIEFLTEMAQPQMAVITNVSQAHVGRFGSQDNVAKGKGEIYQALSAQALAVINQDSPYAVQWKQGLQSPFITFGESVESDYRLFENKEGYAIKTQTGDVFSVKLPVLGHHNYLNACAVTAMAMSLGVKAEEVTQGLMQFTPESGRLNLMKLSDHLQVIDDSYNANPASVNAAIDVLKNQAKPTTLIVGDMAELGHESVQMHANVGNYAISNGVDEIWAVGEFAAAVCQGHEAQCKVFDQVETLVAHLQNKKFEHGTILVKGSRSMKMERVVNAIVGGDKQ